MFTEHTRFKPGMHTHMKLKDGEGVLVDCTNGNYFVLDDVCSFFWKRIMERPQTMQDLVSAALEEYEAEPEEVSVNVRNFCEYVVNEKLAEIAG